LQGDSLAEIHEMISATGVLPQGEMGELALNEQVGKVDEFVEKLEPEYPDDFLEPISFDLQLNSFSLAGQLAGLSCDGLFQYRFAKLKGGALISVWLHHLVLNCIKPEGVKLETRWITENADIHLLAVDDPELIVTQLLEFYWQGCQSPLPFFAETSFAFAKATLNGGKAKPETAVKSAWNGSQYSSAESEDIYYQQLYTSSPIDEVFEGLALAIYRPLYDHLQGGKI
jgi:exodeoxyribonuclease V gamma subunit